LRPDTRCADKVRARFNELWEGSTKQRILAAGMAVFYAFIIQSQLSAQASPRPESPAASVRAPLPDEGSLVLVGGGGTATPAKKAPAGPGIRSFVEMIIILGLVAVAVYGVAAFLRGRNRKADRGPAVEVLASSALAPGKFVHVIRAGTKGYLVGSSEHAVSLIAEVSDKEYLDALALEAQKAPKAGKRAFEALLQGLLGGRPPRGPKKGSGEQLDFISRQRDRLKRL
jgi:flagellar biogenesis protein FliO